MNLVIKAKIWVLFFLGFIWVGCTPTPALNQTQSVVAFDAQGEPAHLLSAFFSLDNGLPPEADLLCAQAAGQDSLLVVFSHTLDPDSLDDDDFIVVTESGEEHSPMCVTLSPAIDPGELRTVLLIGDFGDAEFDPPRTVQIVGDVYSEDKSAQTLNFIERKIAVTPLEVGPTLVWAEIVPETDWERTKLTAGSDCPAETVQIVRATWSGEITHPDGTEVDNTALAQYRLNVKTAEGTTTEISPIALADLGDNDNNHNLCLDVADIPLQVSFSAGYVADSNGDLNPATQITVN